jgi:hypothetical protein
MHTGDADETRFELEPAKARRGLAIYLITTCNAAWNATIQSTFDRFTQGGDPSHGTTLWTGEGGILLAAVSVLGVIAVYRKPIPILRTPRDSGGDALTLRSA